VLVLVLVLVLARVCVLVHNRLMMHRGRPYYLRAAPGLWEIRWNRCGQNCAGCPHGPYVYELLRFRPGPRTGRTRTRSRRYLKAGSHAAAIVLSLFETEHREGLC